MENQKQQEEQDHQEEHKHQKHQEEEEEQQNHQEEANQQQEQQKKQEEVSQFPLSKRSTPPRTIFQAQSPSSYHSPVDSPLSSDTSSLGHGFSPPPSTTTSQPPEPYSKHQEQQNHQEEANQQEEQLKKQEEVSQFPLSKRSTPPRTIFKAESPPSYHSPVGFPLSSDTSSLSDGFSPPPSTTTSQPPEPNSKHQEQQNHQEEANQQQEQLKKREEVSQFPLSKKSTPPRTISKAQSPPSYHSPVGSPLSSDTSSLSHSFSPPPSTTTSQPSEPNPKPPPVAVSKADQFSSQLPATTTVELEEQQSQKLGSGSGKRLRPDLSILRRTKRDKVVKKALLGFRISGFVFCLVSFSVLAADKDQGWALDSFYNYKEFRYCMAVNVIGFVYSGIQAYDLAYQLAAGKQKHRSRLRCYLDFVLDQILAYLLLSASSSAAVRVDDWQSNWGKDKFPEMARASMALSLVAFIAFALSSLVSGYSLFTFKSM